jgi:4-alpha-glucanotransferase
VTVTPQSATGRSAGLLLPLFSMPSSRSWGIGEFADVPVFARWMRGAGLSLLQVLPLNEMAPGQASPYSAVSSMALDPIFISVPDVPDFQELGGEEALDAAARGLLDHARSGGSVDYWSVRTLKDRALRSAFRRFLRHEWTGESERAGQLRAFIRDEAWWLDDYALYRAAQHAAGGQAWTTWPDAFRSREPVAMAAFRQESGREILFRQYLQWIAHEQWAQARRRSPGLRVSGDFPFGVAVDSADVWSNQDLFSFDGSVGAPPDAFSKDGQNWQLPMYRWDVMRERGYAWFGARARRAAELFHLFRVDHVVGLFRSWVFPRDGSAPHFVPAGEAAQNAQGEAVLRAIMRGGAGVIAEDLGTIPQFVRHTLGELGLPGYRVMRWERFWDEPGQPFVNPAEYPASSVATTGTHDTETLAIWWTGADRDERQAALTVAATAWRDQQPPEIGGDTLPPAVRDALLETMFASGSDLLTLPIQDVFGWPDRINVPALIDDSNWTWRLPWPVDELAAQPEAAERQRTLRCWSERHARG